MRNGIGVQTSPGSSFPAVPATLIESTKFNNIINDINTVLTQSISNDGQTPILANLPMGGFKHTGAAAASAAGEYVEYSQVVIKDSQPAFSAWLSTPQTLTNTIQKIIYQSKEYDTSNNFNTASGAFTPNVAGYYQINVGVRFGDHSSNNIVAIYKNGEINRYIGQHSPGAVDVSGSVLIFMDGVTDYLEVWAAQGVTAETQTGNKSNYFQGCLLRRY